MPRIKKLLPHHIKFINLYLETGNATESARQCGFKNPNTSGMKVLQMTLVKDEIEKRQKEMATNTLISKIELLNELKDILDNCKHRSPRVAIEAIKQMSRMLGYDAPIQANLNLTQEQPLFGPIDEDYNYTDYEDLEEDS